MVAACQKRVSFIIPWSDRPVLAATLKENRGLFSPDYSQVIIVNAGGNFSSLKDIVTESCIPNITVVNLEGAKFNKSCCLNIGVSHAEENIIFLLDCDVLITKETVDNALAMLDLENFLTIRDGIESNPEAHPQVLNSLPWLKEKIVTTEFMLANGNSASFEFRQSSSGRSVGGLLLLNKKHYLSVEGADSQLEGWGFEDFDLQIRLQAMLGIRRISTGYITHITHNTANFSDLQMNNLRNMKKCSTKYEHGNFLGSYSEDVAQWGPKAKIF